MDPSPRRRPARADVAVALLALVLLGFWTFVATRPDQESVRHLVAVAVSVLLQTGALAWRRSHPILSALVILLVTAARFALGVGPLPSDFTLAIALYSVTANAPAVVGRVALLVISVGSVGYLITLALAGSDRTLVDGVILLAIAIAAWALGTTARTRAEQVAALETRNERLEIEREQQAQIAAAAERTRIAREMHDIIAHSLTVIIAQADGGRYAAQQDPSAGERALATISEVGRASLADTRRLLGVLREPHEGSTPISPQPMEADLEELVGHVREAGVRVSLVRMGDPRTLPPGAGLTVYRIVQEALTNVMKHAGPNVRVTVLVQWLFNALNLEITDDGRGAAASSDGKGQGLVGMRERAAIFGGTVSAGPRTGGGYAVKILLPLPEDRSRPQPPSSSPTSPPAAPANPAGPTATTAPPWPVAAAAVPPEPPTRATPAAQAEGPSSTTSAQGEPA